MDSQRQQLLRLTRWGIAFSVADAFAEGVRRDPHRSDGEREAADQIARSLQSGYAHAVLAFVLEEEVRRYFPPARLPGDHHDPSTYTG